MADIIAVANQKGGIAKTTTTVHLAHYAAEELGLRVLLLDMDKQGSLSMSFPVEQGGLMASEIYVGATKAPGVYSPNISIVSADRGLLAFEGKGPEEAKVFARNVRALAAGYDLCLIDTPPGQGWYLTAALAAASKVLTPVSVGLYELAGVRELMMTIHTIKTKGLNPGLRHIGILPSKVNTRSKDELAQLAQLREAYPNVILPVTINERTAVKKAIAQGKPVWQGTKGEGHLSAAREWRSACRAILGDKA